ncbi:MAG: UvrD-helicase domain-containing protein [Culturomica sp.]|jgi:ATP-dependent exoDNAse (exonuclease V) beta subunit|nr:UvrD-helicase domain-containing protein [Culturomica sp.]
MSELNIYKASAGSGKTFSLTMDYFRLIFNTPSDYRNILAVTFTNKATEEMKSRIINELHKLAENQGSAYAATLKKEFGFNDNDLRNAAVELRTLLLHDYGRISVTTIDRFFQRIVRAFTKELGIFAGYNVELDSDYVLKKAVDNLMEHVGNDVRLREWLLELMNANVDDGKTWNVKSRLITLASELFKENYMLFDKEVLRKFNDKEFLKTYRGLLNGIINNYEKSLLRISEEALKIITDNGLFPEDFKNGSRGCIGHFYKLAGRKFDDITDTVRKSLDNIEIWMTKKIESDVKMRIEAVYPQLNELLKDAVSIFDNDYRYYISALEIKKNLYQLGLLSDIYKEVRLYCEEKGIMLLSDTSHILNLLVAGNDTPFLYEKSGNYYKHIMIDEFQDTSAMQWKNFSPLIANTLSQDFFSLIVGDVKQSIYRWRNGDWSLLASKVEHEFSQFGSHTTFLGSNWRSCRNIVDFNNNFFTLASDKLKQLYDKSASEDNVWSSEIEIAYEGLEQKAEIIEPVGYVNIKFCAEKKAEDSDVEIMQEIIGIIEDITARGGSLKDTVILVRDGKEGEFVANQLMEYNKIHSKEIRFVSNDSLYLRVSPCVRFIIALLNYIVEPYDIVNKTAAIFLYSAYIKGKHDNYDSLFGEFSPESFSNFLENDFLLKMSDMMSFSLYETVEMLIDRFQLKNDEEELSYIIGFQDMIYEYEQNNSNNIPMFLEWWEKEKNKRVLTSSEDTDAIKILTIHKSKGLEFDFVLLPFCNWELDTLKPMRRIWCDITDEKFKGLDYIPLNYSTKLADSIFDKNYYDEHLKAFVDALNLLYVAMTRPKRELYVRPYSPVKDKNDAPKEPKTIGELMYSVLDVWKNEGYAEFTEGDNIQFSMGLPTKFEACEKDKKDELYLTEYPVNEYGNRIAVKYNFAEFIDLENGYNEAINKGKLLHEIFRSIKYKDDVGEAVERVYRAGLLRENEKDYYKNLVNSYLRKSEVTDWFDTRLTVINEREILLPSGKIVRPDRVMISGDKVIVVDYKFGEKEKSNYSKQLRLYMNILSDVGYKEIEGYIWYVTLDKIEKI